MAASWSSVIRRGGAAMLCRISAISPSLSWAVSGEPLYLQNLTEHVDPA